METANWQRYSETLEVIYWWITSKRSVAYIKTEKGKTYETSVFDENIFASLVWQIVWDRIAEIRMNSQDKQRFLKSDRIDDSVKSKLRSHLNINF